MKNLKNTILLCSFIVALLFASANKADAQKVEFGLRYMPTFSTLDVKIFDGNTLTTDGELGFGAGLILGFNFTDHVGIQGEVIYNEISQKYKELDVERNINLKYVNIPLLFSLNTGKTNVVNFNAVVGPQIGISVGSDISTSGGDGTNNADAVLSVKKGDLGFAYGAGLDFGLNSARTIRLGLGFRGVYGLFDISDNEQNQTTDSYFVLDRTNVKTYSGYAGLSILF